MINTKLYLAYEQSTPQCSNNRSPFQTQTIDMVYPVKDGVNGLVPSLDRICKEVSPLYN